jgi:hypothetical protein
MRKYTACARLSSSCRDLCVLCVELTQKFRIIFADLCVSRKEFQTQKSCRLCVCFIISTLDGLWSQNVCWKKKSLTNENLEEPNARAKNNFKKKNDDQITLAKREFCSKVKTREFSALSLSLPAPVCASTQRAKCVANHTHEHIKRKNFIFRLKVNKIIFWFREHSLFSGSSSLPLLCPRTPTDTRICLRSRESNTR